MSTKIQSETHNFLKEKSTYDSGNFTWMPSEKCQPPGYGMYYIPHSERNTFYEGYTRDVKLYNFGLSEVIRPVDVRQEGISYTRVVLDIDNLPSVHKKAVCEDTVKLLNENFDVCLPVTYTILTNNVKPTHHHIHFFCKTCEGITPICVGAAYLKEILSILAEKYNTKNKKYIDHKIGALRLIGSIGKKGEEGGRYQPSNITVESMIKFSVNYHSGDMLITAKKELQDKIIKKHTEELEEKRKLKEEIRRKRENIKIEVTEDWKIDYIEKCIDLLPEEASDDYNDWVMIFNCIRNVLGIKSEIGLELFHIFSEKSSKYNYDVCVTMWEKNKFNPLDKQVKLKRLQDKVLEYTGKLIEIPTDMSELVKKNIKRYLSPNEELQEDERIKIDKRTERYLWKIPEGNVMIKSFLGTGKTKQIEDLPEVQDIPGEYFTGEVIEHAGEEKREIRCRKTGKLLRLGKKTKVSTTEKVTAYKKGSSVLILTPRRKLAKEFERRFAGKKIVCYINQGYMDGDKSYRVICQPESLRKITPPPGGYDLIILDEVESVFSQFSSSTFLSDKEGDKQYDECSKMFESVLQNAKRIVAADGFLTNRSIRALLTLQDKNYTLLLNDWKPKQRKAIKLNLEKVTPESKKLWPLALIKKGLELLRQKKKICFIFCSIEKMDDFYRKATAEDFVGKCYSRHNANQSLDFNAEEDWKYLDFICFTTTITVGVNYDVEGFEFDNLLIYFSNGPLVRDVFQGMCRCRTFKDDRIYYSVQNSPPKNYEEISYEQVQNRLDFLTDKICGKYDIESSELLLEIKTYNQLETNLQSYTFGFNELISIYFEFFNIKFCGIDNFSGDDLARYEPSTISYEEIQDALFEVNIREIKEKIDLGEATDKEKEIYRVRMHITEFGMDSRKEDFNKIMSSHWLRFTTNSCYRRTFRENFRIKYNQEQEKPVDWRESLDMTDPIVNSLVKHTCFKEFESILNVKYSVEKSTDITRDLIECIDPVILKDMACRIFKYKDEKMIEGEKVKGYEPESSDNIKFIGHILKNHVQGVMTKKSKRGKPSKKNPYYKVTIEASNEMKEVFKLFEPEREAEYCKFVEWNNSEEMWRGVYLGDVIINEGKLFNVMDDLG
jgi:hypothetical protein